LDRVGGECLQANNIRSTFETIFECVRSSETQLRLLREEAGDEEEYTATQEKYDAAVLVMFFVCSSLTRPGDTRHDTTNDTTRTAHVLRENQINVAAELLFSAMIKHHWPLFAAPCSVFIGPPLTQQAVQASIDLANVRFNVIVSCARVWCMAWRVVYVCGRGCGFLYFYFFLFRSPLPSVLRARQRAPRLCMCWLTASNTSRA
jgi:hypothetical protein